MYYKNLLFVFSYSLDWCGSIVHPSFITNDCFRALCKNTGWTFISIGNFVL